MRASRLSAARFPALRFAPLRFRAVRAALVATAFVSFVGAPALAAAWGTEAHRRVGERTVESLGDPLKEFFEDRKDSFLDSLEDPARGRGPARFFLEAYDEFPFYDVPPTRESAARRFSEEEISANGDALYRLLEDWDELVAAFEAGDFEQALEHASDVTYLVGELGVPPNVSRLGDGQPTGQEGLARRFDTQLTDIFAGDLRVRRATGIYLDRPREFARSLPLKAHVWVDNILFRDAQARRGVSGYDRFYLESMWSELNGLVEMLLSGAARDSASLIYTAWVSAGRPEVPES